MSQLNDEQRKAVESADDTTMVIAGPGSGKTRTLVGRIIRLVFVNNVPLSRIVVLTFTNSAAHVLRHRLAEMGLNHEVGYMGTLHGYCFRILQEYGSLLGYRAGSISIATEQVKSEITAGIERELGRKNPLVDTEYDFRLKRSNMVDYDGILIQSLALIKLVKDFIVIDDLLVDERQDSGAIDSEIFWALPAKRRFFVGDPDQCVFAFRGARPDIFVAEASGGHLTLENNYRSDIKISQAAARLIANNKVREAKDIRPVSTEQGVVEINRAENEGGELMRVGQKILELANSEETAVLARTNGLALQARSFLIGLGIPVKMPNNCLPAGWDYMLNCLSVLVDPANDFYAENFLRLRGMPESEIQDEKLKALKSGDRLSSAIAGTRIPEQPPTLSEVLEPMVLLGVTKEAMAVVLARSETLPKNATASDLLADLWQPLVKEKPAQTGVGVTVSTVHNAKGKEWDTVFVIGLEEGLFPQLKSDSDMEEERRLCFVAMTRARHNLFLSCAKVRTSFFKQLTQEPSRFLAEMI